MISWGSKFPACRQIFSIAKYAGQPGFMADGYDLRGRDSGLNFHSHYLNSSGTSYRLFLDYSNIDYTICIFGWPVWQPGPPCTIWGIRSTSQSEGWALCCCHARVSPFCALVSLPVLEFSFFFHCSQNPISYSQRETNAVPNPTMASLSGTCCVDQVGLKLTVIFFSANWVLGLQACTTMSGPFNRFLVAC